jgi:hypothetical protein
MANHGEPFRRNAKEREHMSYLDSHSGESGDPLLLSTGQGRKLLHCGETKLWELMNSGEIESVKMGGRRLLLFASVKAYVDRLRHAAQAERLRQKEVA